MVNVSDNFFIQGRQTIKKQKAVEVVEAVGQSRLELLPSDCLERVATFLDTLSAVKLLRTSKTINSNLRSCTHFWKHLCKIERFDKFGALKKEEVNLEDGRLSWSGEKFHDISEDSGATVWQKVFQRGMKMRRNVVGGRYELWRLFMTDQSSQPVTRMSRETNVEDLRAAHLASPFTEERRRVRVNRYWNEEFLIVIQHNINHSFNDIFVWKWSECQNPQFLYSHDLLPQYPTGLFPTSFFLWKSFLVLMPETSYIRDRKMFTSMIRVHDLTDNFRLVGQFDFSEDERTRRQLVINEPAHLHRLQDKALALCRTPDLAFYIFSLPDCQLLQTLPVTPSLNSYDLDQRFLMKDNTVMFMFHDKQFFNHLFDQNNAARQDKFGKLLQVNFDDYLKSRGEIKMSIDDKFDCNDDYIEKIFMLNLTTMACIMSSGKIVVKEVVRQDRSGITSKDCLVIPSIEPLQEDYDEELDEEMDTDGPSICCSSTGDIIVALRHFISGRKIHAYNRQGGLLYEICLDAELYSLEPRPGYLSIDLDGNFLVAADQNKICLWNSATGEYYRTISLPKHYNAVEDKKESEDKFCWKGHTDFAFTEDGIIVIHSQRNFPVAADVLLFW